MANAILNFHFKFAFWCVSDVFKEQRVVCALKSECGVCWGKLSDAAARLFHPSCILQFTALHLLVHHHVQCARSRVICLYLGTRIVIMPCCEENLCINTLIELL